MPKILRIVIGLSLLLPACCPAASLKDLHRDKLPHDEAFLRALDDSEAIEPLVSHWSGEWHADIPKAKVQKTISLGLTTFSRAAETTPLNEEIFLALMLEAHYAYNIDMKGAEKKLDDAEIAAVKLQPNDYRPRWFDAYHLCDTRVADRGMGTLEEIEAAHPWQQPPASFLDDYVRCSIITQVPEHGLRAFDRMSQLYPDQTNSALGEILHKRMIASNLLTTYTEKQVWETEKIRDMVRFTGYACGISFMAKADNEIQLPDIKGGRCFAIVNTGPYNGNKKAMSPSLMISARPAKPGETLEDFQKTTMQDRGFQITAPMACPVEHCLGTESIKTGAYDSEGDGYVELVVFERDAPVYPGIALESPVSFGDLPKDGSIQYFRPDLRQTRFPEKMFYAVLVEASSSVLESGKKDYVEFLKYLRVD